MAARDGSDGIDHGEQREPEGERDAEKANLVPCKHRTATPAKDEYKGADRFRQIALHSPFPSLDMRHWAACRRVPGVCCQSIPRSTAVRFIGLHRLASGHASQTVYSEAESILEKTWGLCL